MRGFVIGLAGVMFLSYALGVTIGRYGGAASFLGYALVIAMLVMSERERRRRGRG